MPQETAAKEHLDLVESYFDETADDWSALYGKAQRVNDLVLADRKDAAVKAIADRVPSGGWVLDAGCGAGRTSCDLMGLGYRIHGVDVSRKMVDHAKENFEQAGYSPERWRLTCADLEGAALEDTSFDAVAALGLLQYQPDERDALREIHRVLKPGGVLVVTGPTNRKFANWLGCSKYYYGLRRRLARIGKPEPSPPPPAPAQPASAASEQVLFQISPHRYSYGRMKELLRDTGFELQQVRGHGYVNFEIIGRRIGQKGELLLHRTFSGTARALPFLGRWANDIIAVAVKR